MLDTKVEWAADVVNVRDSRTRRTSGSVDWEHSMDHMASIQEMRWKLDPESTSADLHNLGSEKICNNMYPNNTTQIYKNLQHFYKSKFTTHLQTINLHHIYKTIYQVCNQNNLTLSVIIFSIAFHFHLQLLLSLLFMIILWFNVTFYLYVFCNVSQLLTKPEEGSNKSKILLNHVYTGQGNSVFLFHILINM